MASLKLGFVDRGHMPTDLKSFFSHFHGSMTENLQKKLKFRDEANSRWRSFTQLGGSEISELQAFLRDAGFMPHYEPDGIFGYVTLSAVRLFQEYVRSVEGIPLSGIGTPDGILGSKTKSHIKRWQDSNLTSEWGTSFSSDPSDEYRMWMKLMKMAKAFYLDNPTKSETLQMLSRYEGNSDTRKVEDWLFNPEDVHLLGIRREQEKSTGKRTNDDIFILLINGTVFKFWGSTDPSAGMADRSDEAFLIEGQHLYKFGWHKIGDARKVYKALRPFSHGVLVFRDLDADDALTGEDIKHGIQAPAGDINIHWSGVGRTNFSAGCQVIAGKNYINHKDEVIDCSAFASASYNGLSVGRTRGAYNVLTDLILTLSPPGTRSMLYTLGRDDTLELDPALGKDYARKTLERMNS